MSIVINLDKAKAISHDIRREKRSAEFAPLDIQATIPSKAEEAEAARQEIRDRYAAIQQRIDNAGNVETLQLILSTL